MGKKRLNKVLSTSLKSDLSRSFGANPVSVGNFVLCSFDGKPCKCIVNGSRCCVEGVKLDGSDIVYCSRIPSDWVQGQARVNYF